MHNEKKTKVYSKNNHKKTKKNPFENIVKAFRFVLAQAKAGSKQHIAILIAGAVVVIAVLAGVIFGVSAAFGGNDAPQTEFNEIEIDPEADNNYNKDEAVIDTSKFAGTILPETADAGQTYIDETLFIGDSNTVRSMFYEVTGTKWANIVGAVSMGIQHVVSDPIAISEFGSGVGKVDVCTSVGIIKPKRIIMTYGTNNANWTTDSFITEYKKAAAAVSAAYPYADIIINAIPPVDRIRDYPNITMQQIDAFNAALAEMCAAEGYKFLNSAEAMKDEITGFAKKDFTISDGIHLSKNGFDALFTYIRTHAYEAEDRRPEADRTAYVPPRLETEPVIIGEDPIAVRGRVTVTFVSNDKELGYIDGEVEQIIRPTYTTDEVTAVADEENGGYFVGWEAEQGTISDPDEETITFTAPASEEISAVKVTAIFKQVELEISKPNVTIEKGGVYTLTAGLSTNKFKGDDEIIWTSSNTDVAKVEDGKVTAIADGTATITASILEGKITATCKVTVSSILQKISITAEKEATTVAVGETLKLTAVAEPAGSTLGTVTWKSSDEKIATVTETGTTATVTAKAAGEVTITATVDGNKSAEYKLTCTADKVTDIDIELSKVEIAVGETTEIKVTTKPEETTAVIEYEYDKDIISIDSKGKITGKAAGKTKIVAKCGEVKSNSVTITVKPGATPSPTPTIQPSATPTPTPSATPTPSPTPTVAPTEAPTEAPKCADCGQTKTDACSAAYCKTCASHAGHTAADHCSSCGEVGHKDATSSSCKNYVAPEPEPTAPADEGGEGEASVKEEGEE
ncbi:MAG: Ig-like domain-containing protein [Oscillospiraceae bacterium]|nr:Ig-like domain-containing protein [Oscillospiraceae bacterium]